MKIYPTSNGNLFCEQDGQLWYGSKGIYPEGVKWVWHPVNLPEEKE